MKHIGIELDGIVFHLDADINEEEFNQEFLEFLESKGWLYSGGINATDLNTDDEE